MDLIALSASAARMVVAAASTDPSEASKAAKEAVPQLLGRGDLERQLLVELQLDQTREQLQATAGQEREQARAALEAVWRGSAGGPTSGARGEGWPMDALVGQLQQKPA